MGFREIEVAESKHVDFRESWPGRDFREREVLLMKNV
jgi:hypothetical protein